MPDVVGSGKYFLFSFKFALVPELSYSVSGIVIIFKISLVGVFQVYVRYFLGLGGFAWFFSP